MKKYSTQDLWIRVVLIFSICVILIFTLQGFIFRIVKLLENTGNAYEVLSGSLGLETETLQLNIVRAMNGIVGIGLVYVFLRFDRQKMSESGLSWNTEFGREWIIISIPITIAGFIPTIIIEHLFGIVEIGGLLDLTGILLSLFIAFFAFGIGEEILFRGYLQTILETKYSFIFAAVISAGLFGMLHLLLLAPTAGTEGQLESMFAILFSAFAMGLTFSYAFKATKYNLILPIAIHGFWDFFLFTFQADFVYENFIIATIEIGASIIGATVIFLLVYLYSTKRLASAVVEND